MNQDLFLTCWKPLHICVGDFFLCNHFNSPCKHPFPECGTGDVNSPVA